MSHGKPTLATLKAFIRKNRSNLQIMCKSSFDGMIDGTRYNEAPQFNPIRGDDHIENTLGIAGVWVVGGGRNLIQEYSKDGMFGYEVYNCCGSFVLALNLAECDAKANTIIANAQASVTAKEAA